MHDEFETNFFGTVRVTMNAVQVMRQSKDRRGGLIFNISSLAGVCAFPGHAFYHASKFAVEGWTESVAPEMHPDWNSKQYSFPLSSIYLIREPSFTSLTLLSLVNFCIVEPGSVKSNFEGHSKKNTKPHEAYAGADMPSRKLDVMVTQSLKAGFGVMEPSEVAKVLFQVASRNEKVPLHLPLGTIAVHLITVKLQGRLQELETVKELSAMDQGQGQGQGQAQFKPV